MEVVSSYNADSWSCFYQAINIFSFPLFCVFSVPRSSQGFMHMKLSRTKESNYILGQNSGPFNSVPEIIHFYSSRKLPIKGAEHMSLLYPVAIKTL